MTLLLLYCFLHSQKSFSFFIHKNPRLNPSATTSPRQETQANGHTGQTSNDATHQYIALQKKTAKKHMDIWKGN